MGGGVGRVGIDPGDRNQRQAHIADLLEQAVQRGLVDDDAVNDGGAVAAGGEGQPVKPGGPAVVEVPLEADLVPSGLAGGRYFAHRAPFAVPARMKLPAIWWCDRKVEVDVVSRHHHIW